MGQALIWSREALDDIDSIAEYISRDSLYYAQQKEILQKSRKCHSGASRNPGG